MAKELKSRPSTLLGINDPWVAFCTDRACFTFASAIEADQNEAEARLPKSAKDSAHSRARQRVLDQYLGIELANEPSRFRSVGG
jgi:hypothetical protein